MEQPLRLNITPAEVITMVLSQTTQLVERAADQQNAVQTHPQKQFKMLYVNAAQSLSTYCPVFFWSSLLETRERQGGMSDGTT